jgi:site-specific DNA-cytosine methylase
VPDEEPLTWVDLFVGAGGLSLGFHWAGFRIVQAVEEGQVGGSYICSQLP